MRTEHAEIVLTISFLRKSLSVCAVRGQTRLILRRLEVISPGGAAAVLRRNNALQMEMRWATQRRADAFNNLQRGSILKRRPFKVVQNMTLVIDNLISQLFVFISLNFDLHISILCV